VTARNLHLRTRGKKGGGAATHAGQRLGEKGEGGTVNSLLRQGRGKGNGVRRTTRDTVAYRCIRRRRKKEKRVGDPFDLCCCRRREADRNHSAPIARRAKREKGEKKKKKKGQDIQTTRQRSEHMEKKNPFNPDPDGEGEGEKRRKRGEGANPGAASQPAGAYKRGES